MVEFIGGILTSSCKQHIVRGELIHTLCLLPSQTFLVNKYPLQSYIAKKAQKPLKDNYLLHKIPYIQLDMEMDFSSTQFVSIHVNSGTHTILIQTHTPPEPSIVKSSAFTKCIQVIKFVSRCPQHHVK